MIFAEALTRKLSAYNDLTASDIQAIHDLPFRGQRIEARQPIFREGDRPTESMVIGEGFAYRSKMTPGGERQILSLHVSGEMPDLQTLHLPILDHDLMTLTACNVGFISHAVLRDIAVSQPTLGAALWRETLIESAIAREWLVNVGRRTAPHGLAHLILELKYRMVAIGLAERDGGLNFPIAQTELAECLGITSVHLSRALGKLRESGLVRIDRHYFNLIDEEQMHLFADFDPTYLHLPARPIRLSMTTNVHARGSGAG